MSMRRCVLFNGGDAQDYKLLGSNLENILGAGNKYLNMQ